MLGPRSSSVESLVLGAPRCCSWGKARGEALKAADEERKRVIDAAEVAMLEAASLNGLGP